MSTICLPNPLFCSISFAIWLPPSSIATARSSLKSIIKKLQRAQFGRRSERLDPDQLALALEDIDSDLAREQERRPPGEKQAGERPSRRKPLPGHLSREEVRLDIESMTCTCCGGALHVIGERA